MLRTRLAVPLAAALACAGLATTACSQDTADDIGSAAIRTISAKAGAAEFKKAGYPIHHELTCRGGLHKGNYHIDCDGTTTGGKKATMTVDGATKQASDDNLQHVDAVGKVDGKQAFHKSCLGDNC